MQTSFKERNLLTVLILTIFAITMILLLPGCGTSWTEKMLCGITYQVPKEWKDVTDGNEEEEKNTSVKYRTEDDKYNITLSYLGLVDELDKSAAEKNFSNLTKPIEYVDMENVTNAWAGEYAYDYDGTIEYRLQVDINHRCFEACVLARADDYDKGTAEKYLTQMLSCENDLPDLEGISAEYTGTVAPGSVPDKYDFEVTAIFSDDSRELVETENKTTAIGIWETKDLPSKLEKDKKYDITVESLGKTCKETITTKTISRVSAKYTGSNVPGTEIGPYNSDFDVIVHYSDGTDQTVETGYEVSGPGKLLMNETSKYTVHLSGKTCTVNVKCMTSAEYEKYYKKQCEVLSYDELGKHTGKNQFTENSVSLYKPLYVKVNGTVQDKYYYPSDKKTYYYSAYMDGDSGEQLVIKTRKSLKKDDKFTAYGEYYGKFSSTVGNLTPLDRSQAKTVSGLEVAAKYVDKK